ncbi:hypothetical protein [Nocardia abscessus]|uniref:hypothetical protein n=1 Tax=Nocardia abscessus TaxID=120957 RepID=UPI0002F0A5D2|nr:hypothetical protein [Nocardia abscessus]MCC3326891.1 hypothetical protein [Nocardia abscessus]
MVNYAEEARQLGAENQRRMSLLLDEIQAINEETAATGREFADRLVADMNEFWTAHAGEPDEAAVEAEKQRLEDEAREQREAIARSMAARRANQTVTPVDDEDEEAKFYQRKSWLI